MAIVHLPSAVASVRLGHKGPVLLSCYLGWPNPAALKAVGRAQAELSVNFGRVLSLAVIPPLDSIQTPVGGSVPLMQQPGEERTAAIKEGASIAETLAECTIASALVILPRGIIAVMVRSVVVGLSLVTRSKTPFQTFKDLEPAVVWLERQPGAPKLPRLVEDATEWLTEV